MISFASYCTVYSTKLPQIYLISINPVFSEKNLNYKNIPKSPREKQEIPIFFKIGRIIQSAFRQNMLTPSRKIRENLNFETFASRYEYMHFADSWKMMKKIRIQSTL